MSNAPDYLVCTCMGVMRSEIKMAIEEGLTTFDQLQEKLLVGTGCSSCVFEVEAILQETTAKDKQEKGKQGACCGKIPGCCRSKKQ